MTGTTGGIAAQVLVVDHDESRATTLAASFHAQRWETTTATTGFAALRVARRCLPDIVVLDTALPDGRGLLVLSELRALEPRLPVLLIVQDASARARIAGLAAGADDCIAKPLSIDELILRIQAILQRTGQAAHRQGSALIVGDLVLDERSRQVHRAGVPMTLTVTEFDLLHLLMHRAGKVITKSEILQQVWEYDFGGRTNNVEIYISRLRKKVDMYGEPMIHTLLRRGYVLKSVQQNDTASPSSPSQQ